MKNSMIEKVQKENPGLVIHDMHEPLFREFGELMTLPDVQKIEAIAEKETVMPDTGNKYVASIPTLETDSLVEACKPYFGGMPVQIGYCNGHGNHLGGMEWHLCPEGTICLTEGVFFLGRQTDMDSFHFDTKNAVAFFAEKGMCFLLHPMTLHLAPSQVTKEGFRSIIILEKGTNTPLDDATKQIIHASDSLEFKTLFMKNKWMIAHESNQKLIERGVLPLVSGVDYEVYPII
jgi:hypothetical protein